MRHPVRMSACPAFTKTAACLRCWLLLLCCLLPGGAAVADGVRVGNQYLLDASLAGEEQVVEVQNVIWCTGFRPNFSWIDLPIFGGDRRAREPQHERGIVLGGGGAYLRGLDTMLREEIGIPVFLTDIMRMRAGLLMY